MLDDAPWAFDASPADDLVLDHAHLVMLLGEPRTAVFAVEAPKRFVQERDTSLDAELVAAAAITRAKQPKFAHRARLWGVFVAPAYRSNGLGRSVVTSAIAYARTWTQVAFVDASVSDNSPEALRLYLSLGFEQWGREPQATEVDGRRYDEIHMTLRLQAG
jgi:RimJ/RimL family protein N-acetyltransferase